MAIAAGVPGADLIPDRAELFLGFTSTQKEGLGPRRIANLETLGYSEGGPGGYFRQGTAMHLSHITEDLEAWYINFDFAERAATAFRPGLRVPGGGDDGAPGAEPGCDRRTSPRDYHARAGSATAPRSRPPHGSKHDVVGADGTRYRKGTAMPQRADFNTLDNPFFWSADPAATR